MLPRSVTPKCKDTSTVEGRQKSGAPRANGAAQQSQAQGPPALRTFDRKPSWVNNAGRVDRAACMEVRASELWRLLDSPHWMESRTSAGRLAHATIAIDAALLARLHDTRNPRLLLGDLRTPKSNAMKGPHDPYRRRHVNRARGDQPWTALDDALEVRYTNPNKGAARSKMLALWDGSEVGYESTGPWKQDVRIEKWIRDKKRPEVRGQKSEGRDQKSEGRGQKSELRRLSDRLKPQATSRKPSRLKSQATSPKPSSHQHPSPPNHWHYLICPNCQRKVFKLFMVLALPQEVEDAEIAEGWVRMFDARCNIRASGGAATLAVQIDPELLRMRAALIERYGLLFRARRMVCKTCLGIRYGEVRGKSKTVDPAKAAARQEQRERKRARHKAQVEARARDLLRELRAMEPRMDADGHG